jgi:DNA invertase Pin-like site-specific DNA recombinase
MVINLNACFECGSSDHIHQHHVVPRVLGGQNTIPLCARCHGMVHDRDLTHYTRLQRIGIRSAKKKGVKFGRPRSLSESQKEEAIHMMNGGMSTKKVAELFTVSEPTMRRVKSNAKLRSTEEMLEITK